MAAEEGVDMESAQQAFLVDIGGSPKDTSEGAWKVGLIHRRRGQVLMLENMRGTRDWEGMLACKIIGSDIPVHEWHFRPRWYSYEWPNVLALPTYS